MPDAPLKQWCWRRHLLVFTRRAGAARPHASQQRVKRQMSNSGRQQRRSSLLARSVAAHDDLLRLQEIPRELPLRVIANVLRLRAGLFAPLRRRNSLLRRSISGRISVADRSITLARRHRRRRVGLRIGDHRGRRPSSSSSKSLPDSLSEIKASRERHNPLYTLSPEASSQILLHDFLFGPTQIPPRVFSLAAPSHPELRDQRRSFCGLVLARQHQRADAVETDEAS